MNDSRCLIVIPGAKYVCVDDNTSGVIETTLSGAAWINRAAKTPTWLKGPRVASAPDLSVVASTGLTRRLYGDEGTSGRSPRHKARLETNG